MCSGPFRLTSTGKVLFCKIWLHAKGTARATMLLRDLTEAVTYKSPGSESVELATDRRVAVAMISK